MSTLTCSNFLPKSNLTSYDNDRYLLAVHGNFIELCDLDEYLSDDFNAREYEPMRTHVFDRTAVHCCAVFTVTGHSLAITSDFDPKKKELTISASLVHRDQLLQGGYADRSSTHILFNGPSSSHIFSMSSVPESTEILLLTDSKIIHFRYSFEDETNVTFSIVEEFEIQSHLLPFLCNHPILPLALSGSTNYAAILKINSCIVLLKREENRWSCRTTHDNDQTRLAMIIPGLDIAVIGGKSWTKFISTSFRQSGVSKDQLRLLLARDEKVATKGFAFTTKNGITHVYVFGERDLGLWRIQNQTITQERTFVHSSLNVERRARGEKDIIFHHRTDLSFFRKGIKLAAPDIVYDSPISAKIMNRSIGNCTRELLIISYECGDLKILRTDDILKNPTYKTVSLVHKKLLVENLFPCWEFPLDPIKPLTRFTGLSNGIPIIINLENGLWEVNELIEHRTVIYSYAKSRVSSSGQTIAIFYNMKNICICLFDKNTQYREDQLSSEIRECLIHENLVCILTDLKILIVDARGLFNEENDVVFINASINLSLYKFSSPEESHGLISMHAVKPNSKCEEKFITEESCVLYFNDGVMRGAELTVSPLSRDAALQELFDRPYTGQLKETKSKTQSIKEMISTPRGDFWLTKEGMLIKFCDGENLWSNNLFDYLPKEAIIEGFITIEASEVKDRITYVLARTTDLVYLKEISTMDDVTVEPIPPNFGDNPIFGHFIGRSEDGRCALYTTSSRRLGDIPELLRIEMRVSHSRKRESLVRGASLFQPDTIVKIVRQKDNSQSRMVLSTYGLTMDVHEIDRMGTVRFKKELGCRALNNDPLFISSFDTYYTHSTNTLYIFAGSSTGELMMHIWDMNMDNHSFKSERLEKTIGEVFFFGNEHPKDPPVLVVYVNDSSIKVCGYNHKTQVFLNMYRIPFSTDGDKQRRDFIDNRVHVMCNGDDTTIHDIWIINKSSATLHSGRRFNFGKKKLKVSLKSVKGRVESIFILSTRKNGASDLYADFVFVAKANSRIAVLSTIQTFGELPDSIHFAELNFNDSDSKSSALYGEIIDYSSREQNQIDATIRFFIARSKEIVITLVKLSINTESLNVVEIVTLGKIHTNIMDPSHFVVSRMEKIPDRTTPMYGIISGFEGTQIVRICDKKLQPSLTENGKIEMI